MQFVLKIGSALAERVRQGEVGGSTTLADSAWRLLQLAIEWARSALGGLLLCFLVQTNIENGPFTSPFLAFQAAFSMEECSLDKGPLLLNAR